MAMNSVEHRSVRTRYTTSQLGSVPETRISYYIGDKRNTFALNGFSVENEALAAAPPTISAACAHSDNFV